MLGANVKACNMLRNMHHIVNIVRGGAYFLVWAIRGRAARQGMGFFGLAATRMVG